MNDVWQEYVCVSLTTKYVDRESFPLKNAQPQAVSFLRCPKAVIVDKIAFQIKCLEQACTAVLPSYFCPVSVVWFSALILFGLYVYKILIPDLKAFCIGMVDDTKEVVGKLNNENPANNEVIAVSGLRGVYGSTAAVIKTCLQRVKLIVIEGPKSLYNSVVETIDFCLRRMPWRSKKGDVPDETATPVMNTKTVSPDEQGGRPEELDLSPEVMVEYQQKQLKGMEHLVEALGTAVREEILANEHSDCMLDHYKQLTGLQEEIITSMKELKLYIESE
ncbi:uncharacterized protein LOC110829600 isoform X3 [Zootermopsis nevadensis]|uniref:uncharacterized protein LOC110829600 isoform X3 n=1 Tax=Zootermopsis nevadensis TaxID=136037 RepID=UPI000B8E54AE|nr:uncharacterized protein LOC110829600 isoform X3 [Zootermopsis nevadensis]